MDEFRFQLADLAEMHPRLLWPGIVAATSAVLSERQPNRPFHMQIEIQDIPGFGSSTGTFVLDSKGISNDHVLKLRRTFESTRLVKMAAIAIAGLGLHFAGNHEMMELAVRGTAADCLVDEARHRLEIAGRSRKSDFTTAWEERHQRLLARPNGGFFICVVEFETPFARLMFTE